MAKWLKDNGVAQASFAKRLEVSPATVSRWLSEERFERPEPHLREAIARITGIEVSAWLTSDELAVIERAALEPAPAVAATGTEGR